MPEHLISFSWRCVLQECEGCKCWKNGRVRHSYFRLLKFAKHVRGFGSVVNCSRMLETFARNFKLCLNSRRTKNDSRKQLTNPGARLANFWSLKYECWTLPFFFYICILRESFAFPWKHTITTQWIHLGAMQGIPYLSVGQREQRPWPWQISSADGGDRRPPRS